MLEILHGWETLGCSFLIALGNFIFMESVGSFLSSFLQSVDKGLVFPSNLAAEVSKDAEFSMIFKSKIFKGLIHDSSLFGVIRCRDSLENFESTFMEKNSLISC